MPTYRPFIRPFIGLLAAALSAIPTQAQEDYPLHPDSQRKDGVPQGQVTSHRFTNSKIYPGTERDNTKMTGIAPWQPAIAPPKPRL